MIKIPAFPETTITVEDGSIIINQHKNYSLQTITIPITMWSNIAYMIDNRIGALGELVEVGELGAEEEVAE